MKPDIIKRLSPYDVAMIGNLFPLTENMVHDIMLDKGDIDEVPIIKNASSMRPKGKSMKAADRRKKTFHKHAQREKKYKSLGYHVERLSASERGKLREGVGAFPEGQHMNSMYNRNSYNGGMRGKRKEKMSAADCLFEMECDEIRAQMEREHYDLCCMAGVESYSIYELEDDISELEDDIREMEATIREIEIAIHEMEAAIERKETEISTTKISSARLQEAKKRSEIALRFM